MGSKVGVGAAMGTTDGGQGRRCKYYRHLQKGVAWGGQLGRQLEPCWELQMVGGVEGNAAKP